MEYLFMLQKDSVCKPDCPERTPTCHATCRDYKLERHKRRLKCQKIREAQQIEKGLLEAEILRNTRNQRI